MSLITPEADENTAEELAKRIVRFRQQAEETEKDEYIFKNLEEINEKLNDFEGGTVGSGENNLINALKPQLTVTSNNFKIQVKASLNNDKIIKQVTAVVERQKDKKTIIRYWYEN